MENATTVAHHRPSLQGSLVDFGKGIELGKHGIRNGTMMIFFFVNRVKTTDKEEA